VDKEKIARSKSMTENIFSSAKAKIEMRASISVVQICGQMSWLGPFGELAECPSPKVAAFKSTTRLFG